jgi:hypothetical protein
LLEDLEAVIVFHENQGDNAQAENGPAACCCRGQKGFSEPGEPQAGEQSAGPKGEQGKPAWHTQAIEPGQIKEKDAITMEMVDAQKAQRHDQQQTCHGPVTYLLPALPALLHERRQSCCQKNPGRVTPIDRPLTGNR